jgi:hypothetical protein
LTPFLVVPFTELRVSQLSRLYLYTPRHLRKNPSLL